MNVKAAAVTKVFPDGRETEEKQLFLSEHPMEIFVNGAKVFSLLCTEENLLYLVAGRLLSSGIIESKDDIRQIDFCQTKARAYAVLKDSLDWQPELPKESSCCAQNKAYLKNAAALPLAPLKKAQWKKEWIFQLAEAFSKGSTFHTYTAGTHSAILFSKGRGLFCAEDIGRHNALDKALGYMLLEGIKAEEAILFTSGRVPVDMAEKVIRAKVPVLVSKSVPTADSIALAEKYGLTLIFRAWKDSFQLAAIP